MRYIRGYPFHSGMPAIFVILLVFICLVPIAWGENVTQTPFITKSGPASDQAIHADFTVLPVSGNAPLTVKCTDRSTGSPGMWIYDFGDGTNAVGPNPSHTYRLPGRYSITLTVLKTIAGSTQVFNNSTTKMDIVTVGKVPVVPPVAKFIVSPVTGKAPLTVTFTDQSTGNPTSYVYSFGDGTNATGPDQVHVYQNPGRYTVTLIVMKRNAENGSMMSSSLVSENLVTVTNGSPAGPQIICNQPYALCTIAKCQPLESDPSKTNCTCILENGVSAGYTNCTQRMPVGLYYSDKTGWMISPGYASGRLVSTYSFVNALATDDGRIPNRYIDPGYNGTLILKKCSPTTWANCIDRKCIVPPADPGASMFTARKAANYSICACDLVNATSDFYMAASGGNASCNDPDLCSQYIWSAATIDSLKPGIIALKSYLSLHPRQDTAQQYAMPTCPDCITNS
jgi:PKD repeat protein